MGAGASAVESGEANEQLGAQIDRASPAELGAALGRLSPEQLHKLQDARSGGEAARQPLQELAVASLQRLDSNASVGCTPSTDPPGQDWRSMLHIGKKVTVWCGSAWQQGQVSQMAITSQGVHIVVSTVKEQEWKGPLESPDLLPRMEDRGMTVRHLRSFAEKCRNEIQDKQITDFREYLDREGTVKNPSHGQLLDFDCAPTWLVVELFVKPVSTPRGVPYADVLAELFPGHGGCRPATHFASHSWESFFVDLLGAFSDLHDDAAIWICCFAMTQHPERLELVDDAEVFAGALRQETTAHVLVCDKRMCALSRMWVLFELLRSAQYGKVLQLRPVKMLRSIPAEHLGGAVSIQMSKCGCAREHDKKYILGEMEEVGGVKALNAKVRDALVRSFQTALQQNGLDDDVLIKLRSLLANVLAEQGCHVEAAGLFREVLATCAKLEGGGRPVTFSQHEKTDLRLQLSRALSNAGRDVEASEEMQSALQDEKTWMAKRGLDNSLLLYNTIRRAGNFQEAGKLLHEVVHMLSKLKDDPAFDPLRARMHLRVGQQFSHYEWRNQEAESEFILAHKLYASQYGEDHVQTALALYNLAHTVRRQHRSAESEKLYRQVLNIQVVHCDGNHLDVLNTRMNLGISMGTQGKFSEAIAELEEVVNLHTARQPDHPKLAIALTCLGDVHRFHGDCSKALECYAAAERIYISAPHFEHKNELAWHRIGKALASMHQGEFEEARRCLQFANEKNAEIFYKSHVAFAIVAAHEGTWHRAQGQFDEAERLYAQASAIFEGAASFYPMGLRWLRSLKLLLEQKSTELGIPMDLAGCLLAGSA